MEAPIMNNTSELHGMLQNPIRDLTVCINAGGAYDRGRRTPPSRSPSPPGRGHPIMSPQQTDHYNNNNNTSKAESSSSLSSPSHTPPAQMVRRPRSPLTPRSPSPPRTPPPPILLHCQDPPASIPSAFPLGPFVTSSLAATLSKSLLGHHTNNNNNNNNNNNCSIASLINHNNNNTNIISSLSHVNECDSAFTCKIPSVAKQATTYSSPPPIPTNPENNVCKVIEYRGAKIAAFVVDGHELICLPQAFDLFLKHLVGGLHTVYTKLKRLDILPVVCNVEQVRILRGLGAIQPGVNRCKLLSCNDFDTLYEDCTNSSARPGRPPKRSSSVGTSDPESAEKLKKCRMEEAAFPFDPRLYTDRKPTPLLNGFPHTHYPMNTLPFMSFAHPILSHPASLDMVAHLGLQHDSTLLKERVGSESDMLSPRPRSNNLIRPIENSKDQLRLPETTQAEPLNLNISNGHAHLDLTTKKKYSRHRYDEDALDDVDDDDADTDTDDERDGDLSVSDLAPERKSHVDKASAQSNLLVSQLLNGDSNGVASIETLLLNIQGLLKVAAENARHHERQCNIDKDELKKGILRERDIRESLEAQLAEEHKVRVSLTRRLKKEKRARRRLHDQLQKEHRGHDVSSDESVCSSSPPYQHRLPSDTSAHEVRIERAPHSDSVDRKPTDLSLNRATISLGYDSFLHANGASPFARFPFIPLSKPPESLPTEYP